MSKIGFIDNNFEYVRGFISRDYTELSKKNIEEKDQLSYYELVGDVLYGYKIAQNKPLSELYGDRFYSVRFYFSNIETLHLQEQEEHMIKMLETLRKEMETEGGYYNLRIPTHIIDLVKAYNHSISRAIFCGGTVEQYIYNREVEANNKNNLNIFIADSSYIGKYQNCLMDMTYKSFEVYQGQYHISSVTADKAGKIYENWINSSLLEDTADKVIVAEWNHEPIGFVTIAEDDYCVEGVLSAVSNEKRQLGAYKAMIAYIINYAFEQKKAFITSTQFDNFIVQGAWNSLGLKPFYSIYNIHVDNR